MFIQNNNLQGDIRSLMHKEKGGGRKVEQYNRKHACIHGRTSNSDCSGKRVSADGLIERIFIYTGTQATRCVHWPLASPDSRCARLVYIRNSTISIMIFLIFCVCLLLAIFSISARIFRARFKCYFVLGSFFYHFNFYQCIYVTIYIHSSAVE